MFFRKKKNHQEDTYKKAYQSFFGICMRYCSTKEDAKEVFNDAMLRYFKYESKNKVDAKGKFSLLKKIIVNQCIDHVRSKRIHFENIEDANPIFNSARNDAEVNMVREEMLMEIQKFAPQTKLIFNLFIFDGWSHNKIASHLNISTNTSSWHVNQGKKQIIELLKNPKLV
jgi:RNA polymerase sigma-70 factor (ECF subfamily)